MTDETSESPAPADTDAPETTWQEEAGLTGDPTAEKYNSVGDLFNAYKEASSMIGNSVRFPSKEAGEEDIKKFEQQMLDKGFYRAPNQDDPDNVRGIQQLLGMPSEPQGYIFDEIEGFEGDPESEGEFRAMAHEAGLTQKQSNAIHNWLASNIVNENSSVAEKQQASMSELKGEWGQAFNQKMENAKNAAAQLEERVPGISSYFDSMAESGYDANMIRLMDAVAEMLGESGAEISTPRDTLTRAEAQARVREIQNNPNHPANNPEDPHYEEAAKQRVALLKAAYG